MKYHHAAAILLATATATSSLGSDGDPHDLIEPIMYGYCIGCTAAIMTHTVAADDNGTTECTVPPIMSTVASPMIKYTPPPSSSRCSSHDGSGGGLDHTTSSSKQLFLQLQHTPPPPCASSGKQQYHLNQNPTEHHHYQPSLFSLCEVNLLRLSRAIHTTANNEDSSNSSNRNNSRNNKSNNYCKEQKQTFLQQKSLTQSLVLLLAVAVGLAWRWGVSTTKHKNETCRETAASCALVEQQPRQHNKQRNKQYKLDNKQRNKQHNKFDSKQDDKQHNKFDNKQHNKFDLISRRLVNDDFDDIGLIATVEEEDNEEEDDDVVHEQEPEQEQEIEATVVKDVVQEEEETAVEKGAATTATTTTATTNDTSATPAKTNNTPEPQWTLRYKGEWEPPFHPITTTNCNNEDDTIITIAEEVIILTKPIVRRNTTSVRMDTTAAAAANNNANKHVKKSILTSKSCNNAECMTELKMKKRVSFQSDVMEQDRKEEEVASLSCSRAKNKKRGLFWLKQLSLGNLCMR